MARKQTATAPERKKKAAPSATRKAPPKKPRASKKSGASKSPARGKKNPVTVDSLPPEVALEQKLASNKPPARSSENKTGPNTGSAGPMDTPWSPDSHEQLLNALPHPVMVVGADNKFTYANAAAEAFLSTSLPMLKRIRLDDIVRFRLPPVGAP